ncbi:hypothetical protein C8R44DRAFT_747775 [Mycena epipterygia]|nr:hypothetical protein C8R44DRAFT_747775 [Mycena epipterygia]
MYLQLSATPVTCVSQVDYCSYQIIHDTHSRRSLKSPRSSESRKVRVLLYPTRANCALSRLGSTFDSNTPLVYLRPRFSDLNPDHVRPAFPHNNGSHSAEYYHMYAPRTPPLEITNSASIRTPTYSDERPIVWDLARLSAASRSVDGGHEGMEARGGAVSPWGGAGYATESGSVWDNKSAKMRSVAHRWREERRSMRKLWACDGEAWYGEGGRERNTRERRILAAGRGGEQDAQHGGAWKGAVVRNIRKVRRGASLMVENKRFGPSTRY